MEEGLVRRIAVGIEQRRAEGQEDHRDCENQGKITELGIDYREERATINGLKNKRVHRKTVLLSHIGADPAPIDVNGKAPGVHLSTSSTSLATVQPPYGAASAANSGHRY
ncbi:hypothetical protein UY3_09513 [Chelonia mydas]|uniref:Uncharacterized protein n=1 Tax=Chelonia mydas TaxID=8469 RepID=M7B8A7_CHEMY|nr:hypothetical protein UY3_09513 [Chelonia mydas]